MDEVALGKKTVWVEILDNNESFSPFDLNVGIFCNHWVTA